MKPRISVVTVAVSDLERSLRFYRDGLGLPTEGIVGREIEHGAVAFFDLASGLKFAIWAQEDIAHDTGLKAMPMSPTSFTLGYNVARREEVDAVMQEAVKAGASVLKPSADTAWGGYSGYFQDPDGHVWEIVWNPQLMPADEAGAH